MAEQTTSTSTIDPADPKLAKKVTTGTATIEAEPRKVVDEQERLTKELREGKISLRDFEHRWKKLTSADAVEAAEDEEITKAKVHLYESYVSGKITRGMLDRELDTLYAKSAAADGPVTSVLKTPRQPRAEKIVNRYMWYTAAGGLIPVPFFDLAATTTLQLLMLRELCELYGVAFHKDWGKHIIAALVGAGVPSYVKGIPGWGTVVGAITGPVFYGASTYALGKVFIQHFESGETLFSLDPAQMKKYFADYYRDGAQLVQG